jgi:hypothetical protein
MSCAKRNAYGARVMRRALACLGAGLGTPGLGMTSSRHALAVGGASRKLGALGAISKP